MARYKSVHTGPQIDSGVSRALPGEEIDQTRPNRNLLDNWDFRNPVNQRGATAYGSTGQTTVYSIDRWRTGWYISTSIADGGLIISCGSTGTNYLFQVLEPSLIASLTGKTVTVSIQYSDGIIMSSTGIAGNNISTSVYSNARFELSKDGEAGIWISASCSATIKAVKLELGSVSTLANDPPADHEAEKAKCKRYFNLWASEAARTAALLELGAVRTTPVLSTLDIGGVTYYAAIADL